MSEKTKEEVLQNTLRNSVSKFHGFPKNLTIPYLILGILSFLEFPTQFYTQKQESDEKKESSSSELDCFGYFANDKSRKIWFLFPNVSVNEKFPMKKYLIQFEYVKFLRLENSGAMTHEKYKFFGGIVKRLKKSNILKSIIFKSYDMKENIWENMGRENFRKLKTLVLKDVGQRTSDNLEGFHGGYFTINKDTLSSLTRLECSNFSPKVRKTFFQHHEKVGLLRVLKIECSSVMGFDGSLLKVLPQLEVLRIGDGSNVDDQYIRHVPKLKVLELNRVNIRNGEEWGKKMKNLKRIEISGRYSNCDSLPKSLILSTEEVDVTVVNYLNNHWEEIFCGKECFAKKITLRGSCCLDHLNKILKEGVFRNAESFHIDNVCPRNIVKKDFIMQLPASKEFGFGDYFERHSYNKTGFNLAIFRDVLKKIETLNLIAVNFTPSGSIGFGDINPNLRKLVLQNSKCPMKSLVSLNTEHLENISIIDCPLFNDLFFMKKQFPKLQEIYLENCPCILGKSWSFAREGIDLEIGIVGCENFLKYHVDKNSILSKEELKNFPSILEFADDDHDWSGGDYCCEITTHTFNLNFEKMLYNYRFFYEMDDREEDGNGFYTRTNNLPEPCEFTISSCKNQRKQWQIQCNLSHFEDFRDSFHAFLLSYDRDKEEFRLKCIACLPSTSCSDLKMTAKAKMKEL